MLRVDLQSDRTQKADGYRLKCRGYRTPAGNESSEFSALVDGGSRRNVRDLRCKVRIRWFGSEFYEPGARRTLLSDDLVYRSDDKIQ